MATNENLPATRPPADPTYLMQMGKLAVEGGLKKQVTQVQAAALIGFGMELGFQPFTALQCLDFIQGKAAVNNAGIRALVVKDLAELPKEWVEVEKGKLIAHCSVKRKGIPGESTASYSQATAEKAGLWGRGYWATNPEHMLQKTAFAFAARKAFGDILMGLYLEGELPDSNGRAVVPIEESPAGVRESRQLSHQAPATISRPVVEPVEATPVPPAVEAGLVEPETVEPPPKIPEAAREEELDESHYREKIDRMATDIANRLDNEKGMVIARISTFTDKQGKTWMGWNSANSPRAKGKWLMATYRRMKTEWTTVMQGGAQSEPGSEEGPDIP